MKANGVCRVGKAVFPVKRQTPYGPFALSLNLLAIDGPKVNKTQDAVFITFYHQPFACPPAPG
jgi:hypothetical protein